MQPFFRSTFPRRHTGNENPATTVIIAPCIDITTMPTVTPQALVDETLSQAPSLATQVFEITLARLAGRHRVKPTAAELSLFFSLAETLRRQRQDFIKALQHCLNEELNAALNEDAETPHMRRPSPLGGEDDLGLIDEAQALEDVAVAGVINAIQEHSGFELTQLSRVFDALRGSAHSKRDINPLRPSIFASLLRHALHELILAPPARVALLRVAGHAMAEALVPIYASLSKHVHDADLLSLLANAKQVPASRQTSVTASTAEAGNDEPTTTPHTLDELLRKMQENDAQHRSEPKPLAPDDFPDLAALISTLGIPSTIGDIPEERPTTGPTPFPSLSSGTSIREEIIPAGNSAEYLTRIYEKVMDDPELLPEMRVLLSRLQAPVLRVAEKDDQLLTNQEHPVWQFINCLASHSAGFSQADHVRLRAFLDFAESLVARISVTTNPTAMLYWEALYEAQQYIDISARQAATKTQITIEALERSHQRDKWQSLLRSQVHEQLRQAVVSTTVRAFLEGPWVKAMAETMVRYGPEAPEVQPMVDLVDDLLWSVQPLRRPEERNQLRQMLPTLTARLQFGFDLIKWPEDKRTLLLDELMQRHTRLLRAASIAQAPPSELGTIPEEDTTPSVHGSMDSISPTESKFWDDTDVDRGELPTVPVPLGSYDEDAMPATLDAWLVGLRLGSWCHLFLHGEWLTSQLTWISDSRNYFVFSGGQEGGAPLSLTRGAMLQLRAAGLLAELEERPLVQRAVDNLMQTLEH